MADLNYPSRDVALHALRRRIDLMAPVLEGAEPGSPLRGLAEVFIACYRQAVEQLEGGYQVALVASAASTAGLSATGSTGTLLALADTVALLTGQRLPVRSRP